MGLGQFLELFFTGIAAACSDKCRLSSGSGKDRKGPGAVPEFEDAGFPEHVARSLP